MFSFYQNMAHPTKKVRKDADEIFYQCKNDKTFLRSLALANVCIDQGMSQMNAAYLELDVADPSKCVSFSRATCYTRRYAGKPIALGSLFHSGVEIIKRFVESPIEDCVPDDASSKEALKKLLMFVSDEPPEEIFKSGRFSKCAWAVFLAEHVLSRLTVTGHYKLDEHYPGSSSLQKDVQGPYFCACKNEEEISGEFADTSFGCTSGWHGSLDILIDSVPACVTSGGGVDGSDIGDDNDCSVISDCSRSSTEETGFNKSDDIDHKHLYSPCIVFSFLQRKNDPSLNNYLIPLLGINGSKVNIQFYDCENDLLLKTAQLDLTGAPGEYKLNVIVLLWLTLNYKIFCTGVPESMRQYEAKFPEKVGDKMVHYVDDVKYKIAWRRKVVEDDDLWSHQTAEAPLCAYTQFSEL